MKKKKISTIFSRLKNIWAWSAYHPTNPPDEVGFTFTNYIKAQPTQFIEPISFKEKFEQAKNIDNLLDNN